MANPVYQYSNGIDLKKVLPALEGRVLWFSDAGENGSQSGRYFDDGSFHSLVSERTYRAVQPDEKITDESFSESKTLMIRASVMRALNTVFSNQKPLVRSLVFDDSMRQLIPIPTEGDIIGYRITVPDEQNLTVRLLAAVLHFTADTPVKLYLWKSGNATPIWEATVQANANERSAVPLPACYLSYAAHKTTEFCFGFKKSELQNGSTPLYNQYAQVNDVALVCAEQFVGDSPIDDAGRRYISYPCGLNLEIAVQYDYTDAVVAQPEVFDELIGLTGASFVLEQILYTNRSNADERAVSDSISRLMMQLDLTGSAVITSGPTSVTSLRDRITKEAQMIRESFNHQSTGVFNSSC